MHGRTHGCDHSRVVAIEDCFQQSFSVVATIEFSTTMKRGYDYRRLSSATLGVVVTTTLFLRKLCIILGMVATTSSLWLRPRDVWTKNFPFLGLFWPIFQFVFKGIFQFFLGFEL